MSTVRATETFHHAGGTTVGGTELSTDDPIAQAFAPLFEAVDSPVADQVPWDGTRVEETPPEVIEDERPYSEWTYLELRNEAKDRGLEYMSGKIPDLIERLESWDREHSSE